MEILNQLYPDKVIAVENIDQIPKTGYANFTRIKS